MNLADTYNRIAEDWHKDHLDDSWWTEETEHFITLLPEGATVLDVGCGSGTKSKYMKSRGLFVVGIDISDGLLAIARRESPDIEFVNHSMMELDSFPGQFDGVFAQASLLHIPKADAPGVVRQMAGKTKPGGHVYIAVKQAHEGTPEEEIKKEDDYGYEYERFFSYYTPLELESYAKDAGLIVLANTSSVSGNTTWLQIVCQKPLA